VREHERWIAVRRYTDRGSGERSTYSNYDFESFLGWRLRKAEDDIRRIKARMAREADEQQALALAGPVQEHAPPQQ